MVNVYLFKSCVAVFETTLIAMLYTKKAPIMGAFLLLYLLINEIFNKLR